ncbi:hypothetical protein J2Z42_002393 [Clostridium algifaecis]|uniref:Sporulation protein YjcZ n=1 Tax=Clostridium algifaecis TaxID=1472040 RepID=A0ABS4KW03_9CLOT|nr:hypothetical protein [Clostridium algifaecis]
MSHRCCRGSGSGREVLIIVILLILCCGIRC